MSERAPIGGVGVLVPVAGLDIKIVLHGDTLNAGTLILLMAQHHTAATECNIFLSKVGFSIMMMEVDRNVWLLLQFDFALGIIIILYY